MCKSQVFHFEAERLYYFLNMFGLFAYLSPITVSKAIKVVYGHFQGKSFIEKIMITSSAISPKCVLKLN